MRAAFGSVSLFLPIRFTLIRSSLRLAETAPALRPIFLATCAAEHGAYKAEMSSTVHGLSRFLLARSRQRHPHDREVPSRRLLADGVPSLPQSQQQSQRVPRRPFATARRRTVQRPNRWPVRSNGFIARFRFSLTRVWNQVIGRAG